MGTSFARSVICVTHDQGRGLGKEQDRPTLRPRTRGPAEEEEKEAGKAIKQRGASRRRRQNGTLELQGPAPAPSASNVEAPSPKLARDQEESFKCSYFVWQF